MGSGAPYGAFCGAAPQLLIIVDNGMAKQIPAATRGTAREFDRTAATECLT